MYDDEAPSPIISSRSKYYKVAKFPTRNIKTPIVLVYGGSDSLVDINVMLKELPRHTVAKEIPHYEHLDFLWAESVDQLVFPHVFDALEEHAGSEVATLEHQKESRFRSPIRFGGLLSDSSAFQGQQGNDAGDESAAGPAALRPRKTSQVTKRAGFSDASPTEHGPSPQSKSAQMSRIPHPKATYAAAIEHDRSPSQSTTVFPPPAAKVPIHTVDSPAASTNASHITAQSSSSRPEGWWSSDEVAGTEQSTPSTPNMTRHSRRQSFDSQRSGKMSRFGDKGITIGVSKAVSGITSGEGHGEGTGSGKDSENLLGLSAEEKKKKKKIPKRRTGSGTPQTS
jgi:lysosomal acid lipase/cholesteryl ester hydrolase